MASSLSAALLRAARLSPRVASTLASPAYSATALGAGSLLYGCRGGIRAYAAKSDPADVLPKVKEGEPGETPSILDQATGLERAEIEHPDLFRHNEVLRGDFGTDENPVLIQSNFDARIVGCTGHAAPDDHDLHWINVEKDQIATCGQCQQKFRLEPL